MFSTIFDSWNTEWELPQLKMPAAVTTREYELSPTKDSETSLVYDPPDYTTEAYKLRKSFSDLTTEPIITRSVSVVSEGIITEPSMWCNLITWGLALGNPNPSPRARVEEEKTP